LNPVCIRAGAFLGSNKKKECIFKIPQGVKLVDQLLCQGGQKMIQSALNFFSSFKGHHSFMDLHLTLQKYAGSIQTKVKVIKPFKKKMTFDNFPFFPKFNHTSRFETH